MYSTKRELPRYFPKIPCCMSTNQICLESHSLLSDIHQYTRPASQSNSIMISTKLPSMMMLRSLCGISGKVRFSQHFSYLCDTRTVPLRHSGRGPKTVQIITGDLDKRQFSDSRTVMAEANPTNGFFSMGLNTLKVWNMERRNEERASRRGREAKRDGG